MKISDLNLTYPTVMGVVNATPDSFSDIGRYLDPDAALAHTEKLIREGAAIIDVGGEATNPGLSSLGLTAQQELDRVVPIVEKLAQNFSIPISVDTSRPEVMRAVVGAGASLINDIRALRAEGALQTVADLAVPVCLMHMVYPEGRKEPLAEDVANRNIMQDVRAFLSERVAVCEAAGISRDQIVIDPGIGHGSFGKNSKENLLLLNQLRTLETLNLPILVGVSRKTFIGKLLDQPPEDRLPGSLAAATIAIMNGASIIRAHDVKATVEAVKIAQAVCESQA